MKHSYTWNHILLFAKLCGQIDDEDSATASWVRITEEHNKQTFPFTLWPLTYRTCEVTTSPAMCTPVHIPSTDATCDYNVKMLKCNEVVIICIQENSCGDPCHHPCRADLGGAIDEETGEADSEVSFDNHEGQHSYSKAEPLLPCHAAHCYHRMKTDINDAFYAIQDSTESVICIGHGAGATMASCLASDMSRTYEAEKEFLGLETRRVAVDFVGFSDNIVASPAYWDECSYCIDKYICISLEACATATNASVNMIRNPRCSRVVIDTLSPLTKTPSISRSMSVLNKFRGKNRKDKIFEKSKDVDRHISEYTSALNARIHLSFESDS